jgi:hypothetical protein
MERLTSFPRCSECEAKDIASGRYTWYVCVAAGRRRIARIGKLPNTSKRWCPRRANQQHRVVVAGSSDKEG